MHSITGEVCSRDIVQFVPFRRYANNYRSLAREILIELADQIKEFFEEKGIVPNPHIMKIKATKPPSLAEILQKNAEGELVRKKQNPRLKIKQ